MRSSRAVRRRRPPLLLGGAALLGMAGTALLVWSLGFAGNAPESKAPPPGSTPVPVAAMALPAYTELRLEHLLDARTGSLAVVHIREESVLPETITDPSELMGRVLARDKAAARVFSESDLMPRGTRPGIVAGIPEGKRAVRIDAGKVSGIVGLNRGDRFDLVATRRLNASGQGSVYGAGTAGLGAGAMVKPIVRNGAVVQPLEQRSLPPRGGASRGAVVQEMVIAVAPEEVAALTQALETASRIDCVPRSGRPGEDGAGDAPETIGGSTPFGSEEIAVVDTIEGNQRSLRAVPSGGTSGQGAGR